MDKDIFNGTNVTDELLGCCPSIPSQKPVTIYQRAAELKTKIGSFQHPCCLYPSVPHFLFSSFLSFSPFIITWLTLRGSLRVNVVYTMTQNCVWYVNIFLSIHNTLLAIAFPKDMNVAGNPQLCQRGISLSPITQYSSVVQDF